MKTKTARKKKSLKSVVAAGDVLVKVSELNTPVEAHLMSEIREVVQGFEAVNAQRPLRIELGTGLYKTFRYMLCAPQISADETGHDEVRGLRFSGVPIVSGSYDGIRVCS
tara:strand:+ start:1177 stop:1506 length:330 start_codon:yes stop_codon:yes gene_type:complete